MHLIRKNIICGIWGKEYINNVFIQLVHVIIYASLISIALEVAKTSTILGSILAIFLMGFMFKGEKILRKILSFESRSLGGLSEGVATAAAGYAMFANRKRIIGAIKSVGIPTGADFVTGVGEKLSPVAHKIGNKMKQSETYNTVASGFAAAKNTAGKILTDIDADLNDGKEPKGDYRKRAASYKGEVSDFFKKAYRQNKYKTTYKPTKQLKSKIDKLRKEHKEARRAYIRRQFGTVSHSAVATAASAVAIPLLVVSPQLGLAASSTAITAINKAFFNKKKLKKPRVSKKGEPGEKKTYSSKKRLLFTFGEVGKKVVKAGVVVGTGGMALGYKHVYDDAVVDFQKLYGHKNIEEGIYETTYPDMLDKLKQAQNVEQEIVEQIEEIEISQVEIQSTIKTAAVDKKSREAQEQIDSKLDERQLDNALSKIFDTVDEDTIKKAVAEYMVKNNLDNVSASDIREIQKLINEMLRRQGKMITVTDDFTNNIRDEIKRQLNLAKKHNNNNNNRATHEQGKQEAKQKTKVQLIDIEKLCQEVARENNIDKTIIKEIMKDITNDKKIHSALEKEHKRLATERITELIEEKIKDQQAIEAFKTKMEEKFNMNQELSAEEEKRQEQQVDEIITKLRPQQLIDVMQSSLRKEGSIDRNLGGNKFEDLMKNVVKLDAINGEYEELAGEKIYEDIGELIKSLRKQFRNKKKKEEA